MSRSIWKGPFVDGYLLKKAEVARDGDHSRANGSDAGMANWSS